MTSREDWKSILEFLGNKDKDFYESGIMKLPLKKTIYAANQCIFDSNWAIHTKIIDSFFPNQFIYIKEKNK